MIPRPEQNPENRLLSDVVVHAAVVFSGKDSEILKPFFHILNAPGDLKVVYLLAVKN